MDMPERIWAGDDAEEGGWWLDEPVGTLVEYRRVVRCAECTCEDGGRDCNWIKSPPDPAVAKLVEALEFYADEDGYELDLGAPSEITREYGCAIYDKGKLARAAITAFLGTGT